MLPYVRDSKAIHEGHLVQTRGTLGLFVRDIFLFNTIKHERHSNEVQNVPHDSCLVPLHRTRRTPALSEIQSDMEQQQHQAENKYSQVFATWYSVPGSNHTVTV